MPKKVGTIAFAVTLILIGITAIADRLFSTDSLGRLLDWWPLLLVVIGAEIVWHQSCRPADGEYRRWRVDGKSIVLLILVLVLANGYHAARQFSGTVSSIWNSGGFNGLFNAVNHNGISVALPDKSISAQGTDAVQIENKVGRISVVGTAGNDIKVSAVAWVNTGDQASAKQRAEQIDVQLQPGSTAVVSVNDREKSSALGWNFNDPTIDLEIQLPERLKASIDSRIGSIEVKDVADLTVNTTIGSVSAQAIAGNVDLAATTGKIDVSDVKGKARIRTTTGAVTATSIGDSLDAATTTGRIEFTDVAKSVHIGATTGAIEGMLHETIGGDYDIGATTGSITLNVQGQTSATIQAHSNTGSIKGSVPWSISKEGPSKSATATLGSGTYQVNLHASTGRIEMNAH